MKHLGSLQVGGTNGMESLYPFWGSYKKVFDIT